MANGGFFLQYFAAVNFGNCANGVIGGGEDSECDVTIKSFAEFTKNDVIFEQFRRVDAYYSLNDTIGGYVYAIEAICDEGYDSINAAIEAGASCEFWRSDGIPCIVITSAPTSSPTRLPTESPVPEPTDEPTPSPTFACPRYWIYDDAVCSQSGENGYAGDRCACTGKDYYADTKSCCLLEPDWSVIYDADRTHKLDDDCKLDSSLEYPQNRYLSGDAGSSPGYLLTEGIHSFMVEISPESQPCLYDIEWELEFTSTDCEYGVGNSTCDTLTTCVDGQVDLEGAGFDVSPMNGTLKVWTQNDVYNSTIEITVTRLDCGDDRAIYGTLKLVSATSRCETDCPDGRIYPMMVPVYFSYYDAFVNPPVETSTTTSTMPESSTTMDDTNLYCPDGCSTYFYDGCSRCFCLSDGTYNIDDCETAATDCEEGPAYCGSCENDETEECEDGSTAERDPDKLCTLSDCPDPVDNTSGSFRIKIMILFEMIGLSMVLVMFT